MARVKNITDDPLDVPSLGLFAVQPGEIVEVPRASDFAGSELWQVMPGAKAVKNKTDRKPDTADEENPK